MAINFPDAPTEGQILKTTLTWYTYTGGKWLVTNRQKALPKNYLVNPAMQISQQNIRPSSLGSSTYPADQWQGISSATGFTTGAAIGNPNYIRLNSGTVDTTIAANESTYFVQWIEGNRIADLKWGTTAAIPISVRLKVRCSAFTTSYLFNIGIRNAAANMSYVSSPISLSGTANTWKELTYTTIPGPTSGTWPVDNALSVCLFITVMCGTTLTAPSNNSWVSGNYIGSAGIDNLHAATRAFDIAEVGIYADPLSTNQFVPFEVPDPGQAYLDSLRFWDKAFIRGVSSTVANASRMGNNYTVDMRTGPAYSFVNTVTAWDQATQVNLTAITAYPNTHFSEGDYTASAQPTGGRPSFANPAGTAMDNYVAQSAR